ncbi:Uma2 family endonuclease [Anabaena aphanizomenioides LEGE 00250]|uniref:Uma2 family endonuclease n=1 Tax=Sphaerospermopsis aphanizomenoides LEGE 00250 TaxID=2777972 RepID=A0ABR9VCW5_9CYAN|nr:Uma2 family endonuclease [Sphaerospermopsis aphanizomenoides]MBE9235962.1 Uma2 family endonuclease [Sphaerospermopsis aphanizomenoides LEGE 00250]
MKTLVKWTTLDYHKMIESGILKGRQCELIDGEVVEMSPELPQHYNTAKRSVSYLENILKGKADVRFNGPITLSNSEPEPDIAIVKLPESKYDQHHPYADDIFWVIEVANTSLIKDSSIKRKIYAEAEIAEYWIINLQTQELIVFRQPEQGDYLCEIKWEKPIINPFAFPGIDIFISHLLT